MLGSKCFTLLAMTRPSRPSKRHLTRSVFVSHDADPQALRPALCLACCGAQMKAFLRRPGVRRLLRRRGMTEAVLRAALRRIGARNARNYMRGCGLLVSREQEREERQQRLRRLQEEQSMLLGLLVAVMC